MAWTNDMVHDCMCGALKKQSLCERLEAKKQGEKSIFFAFRYFTMPSVSVMFFPMDLFNFFLTTIVVLRKM